MTNDDKKFVLPGVVHWRGSVSDFITDARDTLGEGYFIELVIAMCNMQAKILTDKIEKVKEEGYIAMDAGKIHLTNPSLENLKKDLATHVNNGRCFCIYKFVQVVKIETKVIINVVED